MIGSGGVRRATIEERQRVESWELRRRELEWYATDTVLGMVPAADDGIAGHGGCTMYQLFVGLQSKFCKDYPMSHKSEFPRTLMDFIRSYGAMQGLVSNNALVFDIKESLQKKSRMVAGGHITKPLKESVYSGVASLRSLRIVIFLAELNGLPTMQGDIGNAYLTSDTAERVCFRAGPEFGELEGHLMIVDRALCGLGSSGARFHKKVSTTMRELGFFPSFADPDVWMRDAGDHYESHQPKKTRNMALLRIIR
jgi:hypothetical protein